jgi:uncharacterized protein (DUF342 family)
MINFSQLREYMNQQLERDKGVKSIEVRGNSLEEALRTASIELGVPINKLNYEIIERGNKGVWGVGKKKWVLIVYEAAEKIIISEFIETANQESKAEIPIIEDRNGEVFVRLTHDGVFLKVTKPKGKGKTATEKQALEKIHHRGVTRYDVGMISRVVKRAEERYIRVGEFDYNPVHDASMSVDIIDMEMKAVMEVTAPRLSGSDLTYDNIVAILKNNGVVYGILNDVIKKFEDYPQYNMRIIIAEGTKPVNGKDAHVQFHFNVERGHIKLKEEAGRVDFKELNLIENVVAGQVLAKKLPPEKGTEGRTVTGKTIPAKSGNDIDIQIGKNVKLSEDGMTAISEINGQVMIVGGKINVEPIYTVNGDVNLQTGNILFLGTVIVKGSVLDGFSIKAAGNIEVKGNVGKCNLDAEGDIIVHQGILGKNGGRVRSGKSVFSKFIEHAHVEAAEYVVVNEGILHSSVDANKKIICSGRRASIVGGKLRASEEINAKNLGSIAGTETILEVGYDPSSKEKLAILDNKKSDLDKELEELELNIKTLMNLKKVQRKLSEEKETYLSELSEKRAQITSELERVNSDIDDIKSHLIALRKEGKVSASERVFPGVKLYIRDAYLEVKNEFKFVTFVLEHNNVRVTRYEAIEEEFKRRIL